MSNAHIASWLLIFVTSSTKTSTKLWTIECAVASCFLKKVSFGVCCVRLLINRATIATPRYKPFNEQAIDLNSRNIHENVDAFVNS